jgi:hypothetical protein
MRERKSEKEVYSVLKKLCDLQECGIIRARIGVNNESQLSKELPYFSIDNAHLIYNVHPKLFRHSF